MRLDPRTAPVADLRHGVALYVEDVTVTFNGFRALDALSLQLEVGELRCVIGPNGAGKTTLLDVLTGRTRPDSGTVWYGQNHDLTRMSEHEIARAGVGRKLQRPTVFEALSVHDNLALALAGDRSVLRAPFRRLMGADKDRIDDVLALIGLGDLARDPAGQLSHGQKQWLEIGMLLAQEPGVLLVDEPAAGMTPSEIERTAELLRSLAGSHSLLVIEHDMAFVRSIADRVIVLHQGSVLAEGSMETIQSDPEVVRVYLGDTC